MKVLLFILVCSTTLFYSQSKKLYFSGEYYGKTVLADSILDATTGMKIRVFRFYISSVECLRNNKLVYREKSSRHLVDLFDSARNFFDIKFSGVYDELRFNLGIDSVTNVSGALGGDLDPMLGMYWTWQSGYINFKIEGESKQSPARLNEFQLHLGGYITPNNCLQPVTLNFKPASKLNIVFDLDKFLAQVNLSAKHHIMSPSLEAVRLSKTAASCFYVHQQ